MHSLVLELQAKHEKLVQTTAELVNEYNRREKSLEELYSSVDRLEQNKADKEHVNQEIGVKVRDWEDNCLWVVSYKTGFLVACVNGKGEGELERGRKNEGLGARVPHFFSCVLVPLPLPVYAC